MHESLNVNVGTKFTSSCDTNFWSIKTPVAIITKAVSLTLTGSGTEMKFRQVFNAYPDS